MSPEVALPDVDRGIEEGEVAALLRGARWHAGLREVRGMGGGQDRCAWRILGSVLAVLAVLAVMSLTAPASSADSGSSGTTSDVELSVDAAATPRAISADIYGMNFPETELADELHLPVDRWGGNSTTRYNWKSHTTNRGNDYFFENTTLGNAREAASVEDTIEGDRKLGAKSLITIPMVGFVADPAKTGACGYSVGKYGHQQDADGDCGNGQTSDTTKVTGNDPTDTSIAIGPSFVTDEVRHFVDSYGSADQGGVAYYALDNEPSIWDSTHRDVHPQPTTYEELAQKGVQYAEAVKQADPTAKVFGPVDWGFLPLLDSEADIVAGDHHDKDAHGGEDLTAYYLDQMKSYESSHGVRLLDYLDEHFYPDSSSASINQASEGDERTQQLRLDSTRELWDPNYKDDSYIGNDLGQAVDLIPRLRQYVSDHYPGTKIAITEYNFGGMESVNGALTEADALGIFGREGVDLATMWTPPGQSDAGANGFRAYRNYDGKGGQFGDMSAPAQSTDQSKVSIYAAHRTSDGALTMVVINKTGAEVDAPIAVKGAPNASSADVWQYTANDILRFEPAAAAPVETGNVETTLPADSISVIVVGGHDHPAAAVNTPGAPASGGATPNAAVSSSSADHGFNRALVGGGLVLLGVALVALAVPTLRRRTPRAALVGVGVVGALLLAAAVLTKPTSKTPAGDAAATAPSSATASASAIDSTKQPVAVGTIQGGHDQISISSLKPGGTLHAGDTVRGHLTMPPDQQLFLLIFSKGSNSYYDVSADDPVSVGKDGTFADVLNAQGDASDVFTLVAIVLPEDKAASYVANANKSGVWLPPGATAELRLDFKIAS